MEDNISIFIAYASKDEQYLKELKVHLELLKRHNIVDEIWFDGKINPGQIWEEEIKTQLDSASIILLLLSPDFLSSDYCENEMAIALKKHEDDAQAVTVIPIITRPCLWEINPNLKRIEAAIKSKIISTAPDRDVLYVEITKSLVELAQAKKQALQLDRLQAEEDAFWQQIATTNTIPSYRKYLKTYPNGKYIKAANKGIQKIEAAQEKARLAKLQEQEDHFWNKTVAAKKIPTAVDYQKYLDKYPNGKYAPDALKAIQDINRKILEAARAKDKAAWVAATRANTKAAYQDYLATFPNGLHQEEAKAAIQKLTLLIPEMVFVKGGTHKDKIIQDFHIGKYPVTNEEYAFFLNRYGSDVVKTGEYKGQKMVEEHIWSLKKVGKEWQAQSGYEMHPVICVSWYGANEYCKWLKAETGDNYTLPSEWYWAYAASGGQHRKGFTYAGSNDIDEVAWYRENSYNKGENHPNYGTNMVGRKKPNELGLYDMSGNVWEWCEETWGKGKIDRVLRGGSWYYVPANCRVSNRDSNNPGSRSDSSGFRCARAR
ncbi:MAG: SUMF1/EgtB/PvdO family nonheme iron enzyme [Bacteroidota bacterium]